MIPIFRAKKIDSDEHIEGQYLVYKGYPTIFNEYGLNGIEIDKSTLSIHFPDMLDSQGNEIFASLQKDGKGGDIILEPYLETERETALTYENYIKNINKRYHTALYSKIIGIQQ